MSKKRSVIQDKEWREDAKRRISSLVRTQAALAIELGINRQALNKLLNHGEAQLTRPDIVRVASRLRMRLPRDISGPGWRLQWLYWRLHFANPVQAETLLQEIEEMVESEEAHVDAREPLSERLKKSDLHRSSKEKGAG